MSYNQSYEKDQKYHANHLDLSERSEPRMQLPGANMASYRVATSDGAQGNNGHSYQPGRSYRNATGEAGIPEEPESPEEDTRYVDFTDTPTVENGEHKPSKQGDGVATPRKVQYIAIGLALLFLILAIIFLALWISSLDKQDNTDKPMTEAVKQTTQPPTTTTSAIPEFNELVIGSAKRDGEDIKAFTLTGSGVTPITVELVTIGARVNALQRAGVDVVPGFDTTSTLNSGDELPDWGSTRGLLCGGGDSSPNDVPGTDPESLAARNFKAERMTDGVKFTTTVSSVMIEVIYQVEENSLKVTRRGTTTQAQDVLIDLCSSLNFNLALMNVTAMQVMIPASYVFQQSSDDFAAVTDLNNFQQSTSLSGYITYYTRGFSDDIKLTYTANGVGNLLHVATLRGSGLTLQLWSSTRYLTLGIPTSATTQVVTGKNGQQYGRLSFISVATHAYPMASTNKQKPEITMGTDQTYESVNMYRFVN